MKNDLRAAIGKFGRKVGNGFVLETLFVDNELLIKTCSVSKNYKPEDSMLSVMYGSNKKHVNKKYLHIYTPILKRGKIKNTYYCNVSELLCFLNIYISLDLKKTENPTLNLRIGAYRHSVRKKRRLSQEDKLTLFTWNIMMMERLRCLEVMTDLMRLNF